MIEPPTRLLLLTDINFPEPVTLLYAERGHRVLDARTEVGERASDEAIAGVADQLGAIVLTWDRDFGRLITRASIGRSNRYRHAGRISYVDLRYELGVRRTIALMASIEFEFSEVQRLRDQRLIMTIRKDSFTVER